MSCFLKRLKLIINNLAYMVTRNLNLHPILNQSNHVCDALQNLINDIIILIIFLDFFGFFFVDIYSLLFSSLFSSFFVAF